jgi:hypothetical protein
MNFGIREVCDITFNRVSGAGPKTFIIDTAKMSTIESASTTVYAQGGRGNNRLRAWEGEKTVTFTIEDALLTLESFYALTGATVTAGASGGAKFLVYPTSFAGYYTITAKTLFRDEKGIDHDAIITIPNAKLQTTLNLSMASTGDPSAFTFTLDAMPSHIASDNKLLFSLEICDEAGADTITLPNLNDNATTVIIDNIAYSVLGTDPKLTVNDTLTMATLSATGAEPKSITLPKDSVANTMLVCIELAKTLTSSAPEYKLTSGSTSIWYAI